MPRGAEQRGVFGLARPCGTRHCAPLPSQHAEAEDTRSLWGFLWVFSCSKWGKSTGWSPRARWSCQLYSNYRRCDYHSGLFLWSKPSVFLLPSKTQPCSFPTLQLVPPKTSQANPKLCALQIFPSCLHFPLLQGQSLLSYPGPVFHPAVFRVHHPMGRSVGGGSRAAFGSRLVHLSPCWSLATTATQRVTVTQWRPNSALLTAVLFKM